jgi:hypothetical protein
MAIGCFVEGFSGEYSSLPQLIHVFFSQGVVYSFAMVRGGHGFQASDQTIRDVAGDGVSGVIVHQGCDSEHGGPIGLVATH